MRSREGDIHSSVYLYSVIKRSERSVVNDGPLRVSTTYNSTNTTTHRVTVDKYVFAFDTFL